MTRATAWWIAAATVLLLAVVLVVRSEWSAAVGTVTLGVVMGGFGLDERRRLQR